VFFYQIEALRTDLRKIFDPPGEQTFLLARLSSGKQPGNALAGGSLPDGHHLSM
jgi:hypothetical protein